MDLKAFVTGESPWHEDRGFAGIVQRPPAKPLIAAVEGFAVAGGFEIALACDLIVAARGARFGVPEVKRSLVAAGGALLRLPRRCPRRRDGARADRATRSTPSAPTRSGWSTAWPSRAARSTPRSSWPAAIAKNGPLALAATKRILVEQRRLERRRVLGEAGRDRRRRCSPRRTRARARPRSPRSATRSGRAAEPAGPAPLDRHHEISVKQARACHPLAMTPRHGLTNPFSCPEGWCSR